MLHLKQELRFTHLPLSLSPLCLSSHLRSCSFFFFIQFLFLYIKVSDHFVQVLVAKALYRTGGKAERETAFQIVTVCVEARGGRKREKEQERLIGRIQTILRVNEEHPEALHVYGMAMRDLRKISDAVKVFLKILILSPSMFQLSYPSSLLLPCNARILIVEYKR